MKQEEPDLPDPKKTAPENWMASYVIKGNLIAALRDQEEFRTAEKSNCLREGRTTVRKRSVLLAEEALVNNLGGALVQSACQL